MKIGVITFHWAANYGAVLQAYALCSYLNSLGHEAEIINYFPPKYKKTVLRAFLTRHVTSIPQRIRDISKQKKIENFRKNNMKRTEYFSSGNIIKAKAPVYDCYICGSDQIWNMSFLRYGERKRTYTYFLDFAPENKVLASYAASFGTTQYADDLKDDLKQKLQRFDFISVREETGINILSELGFRNVCIVPDPTILLTKNYYEKFVKVLDREKDYAYSYMLHGRENDADMIFSNLSNKGISIVSCDNNGVENWLTDIYYCKFVVTNSFHGVVFSVIFEKPFAAVLIKGSGMNDRIITFLKKIGLQDRIFDGDTAILDKSIDWKQVSKRLQEYRSIGCDYINQILSYKKG